MNIKIVNITVTENENSMITLMADEKTIGTQHDNNTTKLVFTRPESYADADMYLIFKAGGNTYDAVTIGQANEYLLPNGVTKTNQIMLQVFFEDSDGNAEWSDSIEFDFRVSSSPGNIVPGALPSIADQITKKLEVTNLIQGGGIKLTKSGNDVTISTNITAGDDGDGAGSGAILSSVAPENPAEGAIWIDNSIMDGLIPLRDVPIGATIADDTWTYLSERVEWVKVAQNHNAKDAGYPADATTLHAKNIIAFRVLDALEPDNPVTEYANNGNASYARSNIHQWLNSSKKGGEWYQSTHEYDTAPRGVRGQTNTYYYDAGFLANLSDAFMGILLDTTVQSVAPKSAVSSPESVSAKIFLPSLYEMASNGSSAGRWGYRQTDAERVLYPTVAAAYANEYATSTNTSAQLATPDTAVQWATRDAIRTRDDYYNNIGVTGTSGWGQAFLGARNGIAPACNVSSDTFVKRIDGVYVIQYPALPKKVYTNGQWIPLSVTQTSDVPTKSGWASAKVNVMGDSITAGPIRSYHSYLIDLLGVQYVRNYGKGSTSLTTGSDSLLSRIDSMDADADLIITLPLANDYKANVPIGTINDTGLDTVYGGMRAYIEALITRYPDKTIVMLTALPQPVSANASGTTMLQYSLAVQDVCRFYSIPCFDLYGACNIWLGSDAQKALYMPDSLHPSDTGHYKIAQLVAGYLKSLRP